MDSRVEVLCIYRQIMVLNSSHQGVVQSATIQACRIGIASRSRCNILRYQHRADRVEDYQQVLVMYSTLYLTYRVQLLSLNCCGTVSDQHGLGWAQWPRCVGVSGRVAVHLGLCTAPIVTHAAWSICRAVCCW